MSRVWTGDEDLDRVLASLERKTGNRVARAALSRALSELVRMIKAEVAQKTIKKTIGKRNKKIRRDGEHGAKAGIGVGSASRQTYAPHAHLLAMGTADRYTQRKQYRGKVTAHKWIPAAMSKAPARLKIKLIEGFNLALLREMKKLDPYKASRAGGRRNTSTADIRAAMRGI